MVTDRSFCIRVIREIRGSACRFRCGAAAQVLRHAKPPVSGASSNCRLSDVAWASCPCLESSSNHGRDARATFGNIREAPTIRRCAFRFQYFSFPLFCFFLRTLCVKTAGDRIHVIREIRGENGSGLGAFGPESNRETREIRETQKEPRTEPSAFRCAYSDDGRTATRTV